MDIVCFPFERVVETNTFVLFTEPGMKGAGNIAKLSGGFESIKLEST